ncbi:MAG TPA: SDR family NAD(P)-dependent oxidoreductase, partial [Longimicrobiales bacterium]|nr:SDR family NAD(P)-dependent oxidoreductase [Longimicrobiales bacterium]
MNIDLKGKNALVTGGARDIGRATVLQLAEAGAAVAINYFGSADKAETLVKEIQGKGGKAVAIKADVTKSADVKRLVDEAAKQLGGKLDVLVNNAGGLLARKKLDEMDEAFMDDVITINFKSVLMVTQAALTQMNDGGTIVNLSSLAAHDGGGPGSMVYAATKGAVLTATRGMAKEFAPRKIRVNAVSPGLINTTFHDTFTKPEARQATAARTTLG